MIYTRSLEVKTFVCSTQLSMGLLMLINVQMPTAVGVLTFINMINTSYGSLKARTTYIC